MSDAKIKRLRELMTAVTQGREAVSREFTMRVPAEPDRDADLVLQWAANTIESLQREIDAQKVFEASWMKQRADLQRENEELKAAVKQTVTRASCVQCADMEQQIKELRIKLHNQAAKAEEQAFMWRERLEKAEASAITPEMRERIRRAELDAKEHLENGIWGVKDAISDLRWNRKSTAMIRDVLGPILRDLLGEQDA